MDLIRKSLLFVIGGILLGACAPEPEIKVDKPQPAAKKIMQPFRFHKAIEVKPGLTLDIVSWGRGSKSVGAYLVLRSDSTHMDYNSVSGELDGEIVDAWDMDLDSDGDPELYIQARGEGEGSYLNMYIYEYNDNGSARKISFPALGSSSKKGYQGRDSVYIKDGRLIREFPVISKEDSTSTKPALKRLEYSLSGNSFNVREINEDNQD